MDCHNHVIIYFNFLSFQKKWAIKKVKNITDFEKLCAINAILDPFSFEFDLKQDIVISKNNAWQRDFGYSDIYDLNSPFLNIIIDADPIYFDYNFKHYRLEFWKGQYGISTGAEIELYVRKFDSKLPNGIYRSANDEERLQISFSLFNNCYLFSRNDLSWWLTGFDVFKFSRPKNLKMHVSIKFPNSQMQVAFITGFIKR